MGRGVITFVKTVSTASSESKPHKLRKTCGKTCPSRMTWFLRFVRTLSTASYENKPLKHLNLQKPIIKFVGIMLISCYKFKSILGTDIGPPHNLPKHRTPPSSIENPPNV